MADEKARSELVFSLNSRSTPTIVIDNQVFVGFNPERLLEAINREQQENGG